MDWSQVHAWAFWKRVLKIIAAWFWTNAVVGLFGVWLVGEVFRDRFSVTALCAIVPTLFFSAALLVSAPLALLCGCRRIALATMILWAFPTLSLLFVENQWIRPRPVGDPAKALRLVHWNVGEVKGGWQEVLRVFKPFAADAYVISETFGPDDCLRLATALGDDYQVLQMRQIAVIARGRVAMKKPDERMPTRAYPIEWESQMGPVRLLAVDLPSRPYYSRNPWLQQVNERIRALAPDLVLGDFNARRRAWWLAHLPEGYSHAYYRAGAGWSATWPDNFPLWDIDQCILGPGILPIRYDIVTTGASDHRLQVFDFSLADSRPRAPDESDEKEEEIPND